MQKVALHIILGDQYESYRNALNMTNLVTLDARRDKLCLKFEEEKRLRKTLNTRTGSSPNRT